MSKNNNKYGNGKEFQMILRRAASPTCLEVQTNASETGFKTIKTDKGSERDATTTTTIIQSPIPVTATRAQTARTIVVMRHGERMDDLFGRWFESCQGKNGIYRQRDLNMPSDVSSLNRPLHEYECDTSLTVLGNVLAQKVGRAMFVSGRPPDTVYCSPSFRCIQTAAVAASMSGKPFKLRIEPGLFENTDLYPTCPPKFLRVDVLKKAGFDIDEDYTPYYKLKDLFSYHEPNGKYNERVQSALQYIVNKSASGRGTVLIAAHASTVDIAYGLFHPRFTKEPRKTSAKNLIAISEPIPYSANVTFMRTKDDEQWNYIREGIPPITYRTFSNRLNHEFIERNHAQ